MVAVMSGLVRCALMGSFRILLDDRGLCLDVSRVLLDLRSDVGIMGHDDAVALRVCRNGARNEYRDEQCK